VPPSSGGAEWTRLGQGTVLNSNIFSCLPPTLTVETGYPETVSEEPSSWGRKYLLRKAVCRLTGHMKTLKNAHNTRFLRLARLGSAGRGVVLGRRNVGVSGPGSPFVSSAQPVG
jgi:hypothetical protein